MKNTKKKILSLLLTAAMVLSLMPSVTPTAAAFSDGSSSDNGSSTNPYIITTEAQLTELSTEVHNGTDFSGIYFELGGNIPLTGSWTTITDFAGTFDGKGYTISGLTNGLFATVESNATIKNLNVSVDITSCSSSNIGALVGYSSGTIKNCTSSGTISASGSYVGGLIGYAGGSIIGCSSSCTVTDTADGAYVGGLIGYSLGTAVNSYATGSVTAGNSGMVGGFAGQNCSALNCYATGSVTASGSMSGDFYVGGFAGFDTGGYVFNCYSSSSVSVSALKASSSNTLYIGGFDGIEQATYMSNCFSSTGTITTPSDSTNITVNAGGFTGELSGNYTNCYYNSALSLSANGITNSGTGSATAISTAVFGATSTTTISYTTDGSTTASATTIVDALNGGKAVFSSYSDNFSGYVPMYWKDGTAGHPVFTSLWQTDVTLTSVTLNFLSPYGSDNASTAIYQSATPSDAPITTATSGDAVTINGLTSGTTYQFCAVFTDSDGNTYTSEVVSVVTGAVDHAPSLTVTTNTGLTFLGYAVSVTPVQLFADASVSIGTDDNSDTQHIASITLQASGIEDSGYEYLTIDGSDFELSTATTKTTNKSSFSVSVAVSDSTATLTISKSSAAASDWDNMIDSITYSDKEGNEVSPGKRTFVITQITDDGNTTYGDANSATCNFESDVNVLYGITYVLGFTGVTNPNPAGYDPTTGLTLSSPTATGYTFEGWYTNFNFTTQASSPAIEIGATGSKTFYAKWKLNTPANPCFDGSTAVCDALTSDSTTYYQVEYGLYYGGAFHNIAELPSSLYLKSPSSLYDFANIAATYGAGNYAFRVYAYSSNNGGATVSSTVDSSDWSDYSYNTTTLDTGETATYRTYPSINDVNTSCGFTNGGTYNTSVTPVFYSEYTVTYTLDGVDKGTYTSAALSDAGTYSFTVTDSSGDTNQSAISFTIDYATYYTVTFNTGSGSTVADQSIASGSYASKPSDPTYSGHTFGGWYKEATCTNAWDFSTDTVTADTNLYAKWTVYDATVDPSSKIFTAATVGYGTQTAQEFTVENTGTGTLTNLSAALTSGTNFEISTALSGTSLTSGDTATVSVRPKTELAVGTYTDILTITGDNSITLTVNLSFTVSAATTYTASVSPTSKTFTAATPGYGAQTAQEFTVENTGTGTLTNLSAALTSGTNFEISTALSGTSLTSGGTATVSVRPKTGLSAGTYTDTLTITGDNSISLSVSLSFTSNSSSGVSYGSTTTTVTTNTATTSTVDGTTTATTEVTASTGSDGTGTASVTQKQMQDAVDAAVKEAAAKGTRAVVAFSVDTDDNATGISVSIPKAAIKEAADSGIHALEITASQVTLSFDSAALAAINKNADGAFVVKAVKASDTALSDADKTLIGSRPIYALSLTSGNTTISSFGGGKATVSIPYTLKSGEDANKIVIYYISGSGALVTVPDCVYNASTGTVTFATTHFSNYAVGYNNVSFTDVSGWYTDYVSYLAARAIIGGTGDGKFSPDANITRAQFVTILARMSGDDLTGYTSSSFSDVATTDWYFAAVQWAYKNGVAAGSDGKFNPNATITRQDIAVMLARYADKVASYTLPKTNSAVTFTDSAKISAYASDAVTAMQQAGFIAGNSDGSFAPTASATRAQAAKMIALLLQDMIGS